MSPWKFQERGEFWDTASAVEGNEIRVLKQVGNEDDAMTLIARSARKRLFYCRCQALKDGRCPAALTGDQRPDDVIKRLSELLLILSSFSCSVSGKKLQAAEFGGEHRENTGSINRPSGAFAL